MWEYNRNSKISDKNDCSQICLKKDCSQICLSTQHYDQPLKKVQSPAYIALQTASTQFQQLGYLVAT
jgi:hypothetical protein